MDGWTDRPPDRYIDRESGKEKYTQTHMHALTDRQRGSHTYSQNADRSIRRICAWNYPGVISSQM